MTDWNNDIVRMHLHYGMTPKFYQMDPAKLAAHLDFRIKFLDEELTEMQDAIVDYHTGKITGETAAEEVVDALIDLIVVAIGTLDAFGIDSQRAWDEVHKANMSKAPGVKPGRPNPLGLPDLIKPEGWVAPSHAGNHGLLTQVFSPSPCEV